MNDILPIFKSQGSVGRSILTTDDDIDIKENAPISIIGIARKYNLSKIVVIDDSFLEFPNLYKFTNKYNIQLIFGINFTLCNDPDQKDEKSLFSNHKVSILFKNSDGYKDILRLHNEINTNKERFYYECRTNCDTIKNLWTENLELVIPPYNNFLEKNLIFNGICLPDWGKIKPIMTWANMEIPYDQILIPAIQNYAKNNEYECVEVHPILYYRESDLKSFMIYRAISERTKFNNLNIPYCCSNKFSWESYCKKVNKEFLD